MATVRVTVELDEIDLRDADDDPVRGRHVDNLQGLLAAAAHSAGNSDYDPGEIDGIAGRQTRRALRRFKRGNDLGDRPIVDGATWEKLIEFPSR